jgi:hypothetical protein
MGARADQAEPASIARRSEFSDAVVEVSGGIGG